MCGNTRSNLHTLKILNELHFKVKYSENSTVKPVQIDHLISETKCYFCFLLDEIKLYIDVYFNMLTQTILSTTTNAPSYIWNGTNRLHARASSVCFTLTTMLYITSFVN